MKDLKEIIKDITGRDDGVKWAATNVALILIVLLVLSFFDYIFTLFWGWVFA